MGLETDAERQGSLGTGMTSPALHAPGVRLAHAAARLAAACRAAGDHEQARAHDRAARTLLAEAARPRNTSRKKPPSVTATPPPRIT